MSRRLLRVNDLLRKELSELLVRQVKDPRLGLVVTVTDVETSPDLRHARVFVSVLGSPDEKKQVLIGLRSATRYLRREIGERLDLRRVPELSFQLDDSIERGARILALLEETGPDHPPE